MVRKNAHTFLTELGDRDIIYRYRTPTDREFLGDFTGSSYCCSRYAMYNPEETKFSELSKIVDNISRCTEEDIRIYAERYECDMFWPEDLEAERHRLKERKERKKDLEKMLKEEDDPVERKRIRRELEMEEEPELRRRRELEMEDDPELRRCSFEIPPAWYVSYRTGDFYWGIHIVEPLMNMYARSLFARMNSASSIISLQDFWKFNIPLYFYEAALGCALEHETFHFAFNTFIDRCEKLLDGMGATNFGDPILYALYGNNVYKKQTYQDGAIEEGLASAWESESFIDSLKSTPARWSFHLKDSIVSYRKYMKGRSPGYNKLGRYSTRYGIEYNKLSTACIKLLSDTLKNARVRKRKTTRTISELDPLLRGFAPKRQEFIDIDIPIWIHR